MYGFWIAFPLVAVSWALSGMLAYRLGTAAGRRSRCALMGEARVLRAEHAIERGGVLALLLARLVPFVPYSRRRLRRRRRARAAVAVRVARLRLHPADHCRGHVPRPRSATCRPPTPLLWLALGVLALLGLLTVFTSRRLARR